MKRICKLLTLCTKMNKGMDTTCLNMTGDEVVDQAIQTSQEKMMSELQLQKVKVSQDTFAFVSKDYEYYERLIVVFPNREAGIWSRSICLYGDEESASMIPFIRQGIVEGYGMVILSPFTKNEELDPQQYTTLAWSTILAPFQGNLFLVGFSKGCQMIKLLLNQDNGSGGMDEQVSALALVEPVQGLDEEDTYFTKRLLARRAVAWILDDHILIGCNKSFHERAQYGCVVLSAGSLPQHANGSSCAWIMQQITSPILCSFAARCGKSQGIRHVSKSRCAICSRRLRFHLQQFRKRVCSWCDVPICDGCSRNTPVNGYGTLLLCPVCHSLPILANNWREVADQALGWFVPQQETL